jgi:hypothetical protein
MAITFQHKIILCPGSVFCFGTISSMADEEGTLHRIADPPERKPSSTIFEKAGAKQEKAQPLTLRAKTTSCKPGTEDSSTRRIPLSTSSTEKWTQNTRKKETNEVKARQAALLVPLPSKENRKKLVATTAPFYPDVLFIGGESGIVPRLRRWTNRVGGGTSSAGISPTKEPTPKYPPTSWSRRARPSAACVTRWDLGGRRNTRRTGL